MLAGLPPALASSSLAPAAVTRRERLIAASLDALALLAPLVIGATLAVVWLLARTAWGRDDATSFDTSLALAVLAAAPAAWLALLGYALVTTGATPGQRARGLRVEAASTRAEAMPRRTRTLRLAAHPFASAGWGVIALTLLLAGAWPIAAVAATIAAVVLLGGVASFAVILVAPRARAAHDRVAGTRVVRS